MTNLSDQAKPNLAPSPTISFWPTRLLFILFRFPNWRDSVFVCLSISVCCLRSAHMCVCLYACVPVWWGCVCVESCFIGNRVVTQFSRLLTFHNRGELKLCDSDKHILYMMTSCWKRKKRWRSVLKVLWLLRDLFNKSNRAKAMIWRKDRFFYIFWLERRRRCEALGANVMFTTDVGLPQAQVCYICQRYGRRKNHKTEMNSVLKISYFVAGIFYQ